MAGDMVLIGSTSSYPLKTIVISCVHRNPSLGLWILEEMAIVEW